MLSISTIPSIPVCRQAGMLGLSNGVKGLLTQYTRNIFFQKYFEEQ